MSDALESVQKRFVGGQKAHWCSQFVSFWTIV